MESRTPEPITRGFAMWNLSDVSTLDIRSTDMMLKKIKLCAKALPLCVLESVHEFTTNWKEYIDDSTVEGGISITNREEALSTQPPENEQGEGGGGGGGGGGNE